jgi:hypothetical protein
VITCQRSRCSNSRTVKTTPHSWTLPARSYTPLFMSWIDATYRYAECTIHRMELDSGRRRLLEFADHSPCTVYKRQVQLTRQLRTSFLTSQIYWNKCECVGLGGLACAALTVYQTQAHVFRSCVTTNLLTIRWCSHLYERAYRLPPDLVRLLGNQSKHVKICLEAVLGACGVVSRDERTTTDERTRFVRHRMPGQCD